MSAPDRAAEAIERALRPEPQPIRRGRAIDDVSIARRRRFLKALNDRYAAERTPRRQPAEEPA